MNLTRAVAIIKRGLGFRQTGDSDIIAAIQDAQEQLETGYPVEPLPWFLLTERSVATSSGDEERLQLPSDFIMEYEQDGLWLQLPDGGEKLLKKYDADDLRAVVAEWEDSQLEDYRTRYRFAYALTGDYFRIFPTPSQAFSYKMIYYQRQSVLTTDAPTNRWLTYAPWVLIGSAGEEMALGLRDTPAYSHFQRKKAAAIETLTNFTLSRDNANRRYAMGETL